MVYFNSKGDRCASLNEAARRLGVSPEAVRLAVERGDLQGEKLGPRLVLIRLRDLKRYRPDPSKQQAGYAAAKARGRRSG